MEVGRVLAEFGPTIVILHCREPHNIKIGILDGVDRLKIFDVTSSGESAAYL